MTTTTLNKTPRTIIADTSNAAGATVRGTLDLRTANGGILTIKMATGATGPNPPCYANVLIAHNSGATPAAASAGADWKTVWQVDSGIIANKVIERSFPVHGGVMHLEVEMTGNGAQPVQVEAYFSEITSASTV